MQPSSPQHQCSICQAETGCVHTAEERMFGWGDVFHYWECDNCGCLQLLDPPGDLGRFYPEDAYYSFQNTLSVSLPRNPLRRWLMRQRNEAQLVRRGGFGRLLRTLRESPGIEQIRPWFEPLSEVTLSSRILDVGCGKGETLSMLAGLGFDDLTGIDPYLQAESDESPLRLRACSLEDLDRDQFDFIMFHHSFEHLPDPRATLNVARRKLSPTGACLIRIPLASRGPWKRYSTCWVELDAPRHFFLHTEYSLNLLATACGFRIHTVLYECNVLPYAGSELYRRGLPLFREGSPGKCLINTEFSEQEFDEFKRLARQDHVPGWAGRACFLLTPSPATPESHAEMPDPLRCGCD